MFNIAGGLFIPKFCSLNTIKMLKTGDIYIMGDIFKRQVTDGK